MRASGATSSPRCFLSEGVPLLLGGDEFARSQGGNNNAYCHDDELTWFDWSLAAAEHSELIDFTAGLCRLRRGAPGVPAPAVPARPPAHAAARDDVDWYRPDGGAMTAAGLVRILRAGGHDGAERRHRCRTARPDDPFLTMLNAWWEPLDFSVPEALRSFEWRVEVDTADPAGRFAGRSLDHRDTERALAAAAARRS